MTATFLPAIFIPIVGIIFPAFSMALFFIYVSSDDIEQITKNKILVKIKRRNIIIINLFKVQFLFFNRINKIYQQ